MPQPQQIVDALSILNDNTKTLDAINTSITHLVQRSEVFSLLTGLTILLDSQLLTQTQLLTLCFILSKQASITSNPFFKVLVKELQKAEAFDKQFILSLFASVCPQDKSLSEIIAMGKLQVPPVDITALTNEYETNVPCNVPSVQPIFSDPDESAPKDRDILKMYDIPLPGPIFPPLNAPTPTLLMPGHDELMFLIPEINFMPIFDPTQISAETLNLVRRASTEKLDDDDKDELMELLEEENIVKYFVPSQISSVIENNKEIASEVLKKVVGTDSEHNFVTAIIKMEPTLNVVATVKELLLKNAKTFESFTLRLVDFTMKEKENNKRYIRVVCDFLDTFIRMDQKVEGDVHDRIIAFCEKFSTFKETASIYKLLMK
ncbi:hypothetical protein EIN_380010 [Entamoeba invadens IP1]|uniref:CCR4-NOT transcription complex subunit 11 n=1 Tax=Entamoeba invadens IP1 TaxID=370355 RepID=A0A0A1UG06_ENTIV|nr:hypothetical protein EIN_380010 [Entamoeba invadens IP1]ELP92104.1 hypothetical protein EIN_380010 [Entamoeba invadens IP1]|eukprot:XP_004258875.1 hypothetical protein EIN_380010 [Entamoeba invadens IP1]